jgi:histidinol-phosphate phosphatase family protein
MSRLAPAVFVDKDGTLVHDVPYNVDPALVQLLPGVLEGLRQLAASGYRIVVVSNQPGVALGRFPMHALVWVERRLDALLGDAGVRVTAYAWCPHHPAGVRATYARPCACRKPLPGLVTHAAKAYGLDLHASWMIGDILDDIEAGKRAGCRAVLVDRGGETEWRDGPYRTPDAKVRRFDEAAAFVLAASPVVRYRARAAAAP